MISEVQQPLFVKYYDTPQERFHVLPPGFPWIVGAGECRRDPRRVSPRVQAGGR
ncbi:hypothetical protein QNM99_15200 [Pseudomonas sp. PCH446]